MKKSTIFLVILSLLVVALSACIDTESSFGIPKTNSINEENNNNDIAETDTNEQNDNQQETTQQPEVEINYIQALVNLNVRIEPDSTRNNVIGTLQPGERVQLIDRYNQNWYYILFKGQKAYISANSAYTLLLSTQQESENPEREDKIESIITAGMSKLASPYEYGATRILLYGGAPNPSFTGRTFDCSSFAQYAFYIGASIKLQGDSRSQSLYGQTIERSYLKRGDLIFMTTPARTNIKGVEHIGHVAIYLGEGKILHTYGAGGVRVDLLSGVWSSRYVTAKRMF